MLMMWLTIFCFTSLVKWSFLLTSCSLQILADPSLVSNLCCLVPDLKYFMPYMCRAGYASPAPSFSSLINLLRLLISSALFTKLVGGIQSPRSVALGGR